MGCEKLRFSKCPPLQKYALCIIDVRRADEFAECHVVGARLFPLDGLDPASVMAEVKASAGETVWILCKSGMRAGKAADRFRSAGFENVCVVEGGTDACAAAGLPCEGVV
jgi:rhodanese-related sulfurtransferase